jgi:geranylgeranyl diphosphate synthase type 3
MRDVTSSFKYTRKVLRTLDKQTRDEIERLGGNPKLMALLDTLKLPDDSDEEDEKEEKAPVVG